MAGGLARRPRRALHHYNRGWHRQRADRRARSADARAEGVDPRREPCPLRADRPSGLWRRWDVAGGGASTSTASRWWARRCQCWSRSVTTDLGAVNVSLSRDGTLVYVPGGVAAGPEDVGVGGSAGAGGGAQGAAARLRVSRGCRLMAPGWLSRSDWRTSGSGTSRAKR